MKRLLVTGVSGFIGSHFLEQILDNTDWHVTGIASWTHKGEPDRILQSSYYQKYRDRVDIITHDLSRPFTPRQISQLKDTDYIINIASQSHVDRSITEPVPFIENNVSLILNVLELARQSRCTKFIQVSTDEVYGAAPKGINHAEWSTILPSNPYAASKAAQEAIAISYWRTYGTPIIITNTMNNFGERQDAEKFIPSCIRNVWQGKEMTIHGSPENVGSRFYLHARNHADAILFLLRNVEPTQYTDGDVIDRPDRFNVVGERELNNLEMAEKIAEIIGKPLIYKFQDFHATRPGHDRRYALDGSKLEALGWKAPFGLEASLKRTIDWTITNPSWL